MVAVDDDVCSRIGVDHGGRVCALDEPWFNFMSGGGTVCVPQSQGIGISRERASQFSPKVTVVLLVVVAEDANDTEGQDDDEQEKESKDNADYCYDQYIGVSACVCVNTSML